MTNQIEVHPFLDQSRSRRLRKYGLSITAYCPLARGKVPGNDVIDAHRQGARQKRAADCTALSRATGHHPDPAHRQSRAPAANLAVFDFALTEGEMADIGKLKRPGRPRGQSAARAAMGYLIATMTPVVEAQARAFR